MDNAVALVEAYLYVNGYFTVTEYPVIEAASNHNYRMVTDLDIMAVRFPDAGRLILNKPDSRRMFAPDPALNCPVDCIDMIVGEVKEGRAELNRGARDPAVLRAMFVRFGCCHEQDAGQLVQQLLRKGSARTLQGTWSDSLHSERRPRTVIHRDTLSFRLGMSFNSCRTTCASIGQSCTMPNSSILPSGFLLR